MLSTIGPIPRTNIPVTRDVRVLMNESNVALQDIKRADIGSKPKRSITF